MGARKTENRGSRCKYVRISWDEALQIILKELTRVKEKYGMEAVFPRQIYTGKERWYTITHAAPTSSWH
jgi:trimethylamine-N-oxide reductase (cytochrome c)